MFWASNFSIGVAIFSAVNRYLAKIMNGFPQYNVEMEEVHHVHKLDAPSGTNFLLPLFDVMKCLVFIASVMTLRLTRLPLLTMPTAVKALHWVPS